jgi:uroporphyrinogen decarboxylase
MYAELAQPREREVISRLKRRGALYSLHICGNVDGIIQGMVETGADILEVDQKTDLGKASRAASGRTCLLGAVSPRILHTGSREDVVRETGRVIGCMAGNRRFILSPGCSLPGDTPVENVLAFVETGRELGAYGAVREG